MKTKLLLITAAVLLPLVSIAKPGVTKPTVTITSPKKNANIGTNAITATGIAKSKVPIAVVYYSLNGGGWGSLAPNGLTNLLSWSTPPLRLSPGPNSLWVFAVDTNNTVSATNKVTFTYVLLAPVTVQISPTNGGSVKPNYNGRLLQVGNTYKMKAKPAKGFKLYGWYWSNGNDVSFLGTNAQLNFTMASNITLTATFNDATRPLCVITYPAVKQNISNSPINATCRASDNTGVASVWYQLNNGDWDSDATTSDGTNYTIANLVLTPGSNTLAAYSVDMTGNKSLTNTVKFNYATNTPPPPTNLVPASLNGLVGTIVGATGDPGVINAPFQISFGISTFAQSSTNNPHNNIVGNYFYTILSSNMAQITTTAIAPPAEADGKSKTHTFIFTNSNTCIFTNDSDGSSGYITFATAANFVPSTSSAFVVRAVDSIDPTMYSTIVFQGGMFTNYFPGDYPDMPDYWGTYSFQPFSSVAGMFQLSIFGDNYHGNYIGTQYIHTTFSTTSSGGYFNTLLDANGNDIYDSLGNFAVLSITPPSSSGNAPTSIAGKTFKVTEGSRIFIVTLGDYTASVFDSNTNDENSNVEDYNYIKTGPNTARLNMTMIGLPPNEGSVGEQSCEILTFSSSTKGTAAAADDPTKTATFTVSTANNYAPESMAGKSISSSQGSATFNNDGTCAFGSTGQQQPGTYTYAQYSPVGGMAALYSTDGSLRFMQLNFSGNSTGSWFQTQFDNTGVFQWVDSGNFTMTK